MCITIDGFTDFKVQSFSLNFSRVVRNPAVIRGETKEAQIRMFWSLLLNEVS